MDIVTLDIIVFSFFIFGAFLFLFKKEGNRPANKFMAAFLVGISVAVVQSLFKEIQLGIYFFGLPASYTIGVSFYFYVISLIKTKPIKKTKLYLHYSLSVVVLIYLTIHDYLLTSEEQELLDHTLYQYKMDLSVHMVLYVAMMLHFFIYVGVSIKRISHYRTLVENFSADASKDTLSWLNLLLKVLIGLGGVNIILLFTGVPRLVVALSPVSMIIIILVIIMKAFNQPHVFDGFDVDSLEHVFEKKEESKNNELGDIHQRIREHLIQNKTYRNDNYTLQNLSDELLIPLYKISKSINAIEDTNFSSFINYYRIEDAKVILSNVQNENLTIDAIAAEVGFKSRVSFINAFKKYEHTTPHAFRTKMKTESV